MTATMRLAPASQIPSFAAVAPEAVGWLLAGWEAAERTVDAYLLDVVRDRIIANLGLAGPTGVAPSGPVAEAAAVLTDQFVQRVADRRPEVVAVLHTALGRRGARDLVEAMYVYDQAGRHAIGQAVLFDADEFPPALAIPAPRADSITRANQEFHHRVMLLSEFDTHTAEVVRLRCGLYHHCRACISLRLVTPSGVAVDESKVNEIDDFEIDPSFTPAQRAALRFADMHMTDPHRLVDLREELRSFYSPAQIVELALDVSAWNHQKVLVALDLDRAASLDYLTGVVIDSDGTMKPGDALTDRDGTKILSLIASW